MRKSIILVSTCILLIALQHDSSAQFSFQAGAGGGISIPSADFQGSTVDYYQGDNYGLSSGFDLHGKVRIGLPGFLLTGTIGYSSFSNSGNSEDGKGKVDLSQNIVYMKIGPEYQFNLPAVPLTPYIGANLAFNNFSGETKFNGVSEVPSGSHNLESTVRFGIGFNAGALFKINPLTLLDIGVHYNLINLVGKTWDDINPDKEQLLDSYLALNDEKDPLYNALNSNHFISSDRSISTIQITATVLFGL